MRARSCERNRERAAVGFGQNNNGLCIYSTLLLLLYNAISIYSIILLLMFFLLLFLYKSLLLFVA